jgi:hypothetical protein
MKGAAPTIGPVHHGRNAEAPSQVFVFHGLPQSCLSNQNMDGRFIFNIHEQWNIIEISCSTVAARRCLIFAAAN